jgi:Uma2 family endonuclease
MEPIRPSIPVVNAPTAPARLKLTLAQYRAMGEHGILPPRLRVELIEGEIIEMAPIGPAHTGILNRINESLVRLCAGRAVVSAQHPLEVDDCNEPEPDLCLLQRRDSFYADRHPLPADVLLLIEISDSSLHYDRTIKLALYARAGLPRYWIIDVKDRSVIEFTQPWQAGYRSERRLRQGDRLALGEAGSPLEGLTIDVSDLIS